MPPEEKQETAKTNASSVLEVKKNRGDVEDKKDDEDSEDVPEKTADEKTDEASEKDKFDNVWWGAGEPGKSKLQPVLLPGEHAFLRIVIIDAERPKDGPW